MGKFRLYNICIRVDIYKKEYMTAYMQDIHTGYNYEFITFNQDHIALIKPYLAMSKGGRLTIPEEYILIEGEFINYQFNFKFFKKSPKGTCSEYYRNADGTVQVFNSLIVFCQFYIDEFGQKQYLRHESPQEVANREYHHLCNYRRVPYNCEPYSEEKERVLNQQFIHKTEYEDDDFNQSMSDYEDSSSFYDDGLDMDQQSEDFYKDLGIY